MTQFVYTIDDREDLIFRRDENRELAMAFDEERWNKDYYNNPYRKRYERCCELVTLVERYDLVRIHECGLYLIDEVYFYTPNKHKWRRKGRPKWYRGYPPNDKGLK